jgi:hypothetical protein
LAIFSPNHLVTLSVNLSGRGCRFQVQTEEQYVFIHDALMEATLSGNTEICREALADFVVGLTVVGDADDKAEGLKESPLEKKFKVYFQLPVIVRKVGMSKCQCLGQCLYFTIINKQTMRSKSIYITIAMFPENLLPWRDWSPGSSVPQVWQIFSHFECFFTGRW